MIEDTSQPSGSSSTPHPLPGDSANNPRRVLRPVNMPPTVGTREMKDLLPVFDPEWKDNLEATQWIEQIDMICARYGLSDQDKHLQATLKLKGSAKSWLASCRDEVSTWEMFKTAFLESFPSEIDEAEIHHQLYNRRQGPEESLITYFYAQTNLAKRIKCSEKVTMKYVIKGIRNEHHRSVLFGNQHASLRELLQTMKRMEADGKAKGSDQQHSTRQISHGRGKDDNSSRRRESTGRSRDFRREYTRRDRSRSAWQSDRDNSDRNSRSKRECYLCKSTEHLFKNCPRKEGFQSKQEKGESERKDHKGSGGSVRTCFLCKSTEHLIKNCPQQKDFQLGVERQSPTQANKNELLKTVTLQGKEIQAFVDLGSTCTVVKKSVAEELKMVGSGSPSYVKTYGGFTVPTLGCTCGKISMDGVTREISMHIVPDHAQTESLLIGRDFFSDPDIAVMWTADELKVIYNRNKNRGEIDVKQEIFMVKDSEKIREEDLKIGEVATTQEKKTLLSLINRYRQSFAVDYKEIGCTEVEKMKLEILDRTPIKYAPYRVPETLKAPLKRKIEELLESDVIEPSNSDYSSPAIVFKKRTGNDVRLCVDYRLLNNRVRKEFFPMPNLEEEINGLAGKTVFSSLDLMMGYHQVQMHPDSRRYTAFVTTDGVYQYKRVPFGLANAPAIFMRIMTRILQPLGKQNISFFMDDIVVATRSVSHNLEILEEVFKILAEHNLTLGIRKCEFLTDKITYLGHEIDKEGVKPGNFKTQAVAQFLRPTGLPGVRRFLGLTGFFRRFVDNYATIAKPLTEMLRNDQKFRWGPEQEKAFKTLQDALSTQPVLVLFSANAQHEVHTDASRVGLGGVLLQREKEDEKWRPVAFYSRATSRAEQKYTPYELETLAVVDTLSRFKYYLIGIHFVIYTDCYALKQTHLARCLVDRVARWWLKLSEFDFTIKYRAGVRMGHADALSRHPPNRSESSDDHPRVMNVVSENVDWVAALQIHDREISRIREILEGSLEEEKDEKKVKKEFKLVEGRVFAITPDGLRFYVPHGVRFNLMHSVHNEMGHRGFKDAQKLLRKDFFWPGMNRHLKKYIQNCLSCSISKPGLDENRQEMYIVHKKPVPFHAVHIDFCGPFETRGRKQYHIFGLIDAFTRFTILRSVPGPTAKSAIRVIHEISQYFGMPAVIISDNATAFQSREFQTFCTENGIKHSPVAVSTPRANGQIERVFRTVLDALKGFSCDGKDWKKQLSAVQWAINVYENRTTGQSPQRLLLGYRPRNILQNMLQHAVATTVDDEELQEPLPDIREAAAFRMSTMQEKSAERFNEEHKKPQVYKEGDLVLCRWNPPPTGSSRKLMTRYRGPFIVEKVLGRDRYLIKDTPITQVSQKPYEGVQVADRLKSWGNDGDLEKLEKSYLGESDKVDEIDEGEDSEIKDEVDTE